MITAAQQTNNETTFVWNAIKQIQSSFSLDKDEMLNALGKMPQATFYKGVREQTVKLTHDQVCRVSLMLGIYKGLRILFEDEKQAMGWIDRENALPPFNHTTPRQHITSGNYTSLNNVRQFVDYYRG